MRRLHWAASLFMGLAAVVVLMPIVVVSAAALNGGRSMAFPPENPTFDRFVEFFVSEPVWTTALWNSIVISVSAAALSVLIAWPVAYWLWRANDGLSKVLAGLAAMPFALPPIVFGVGLGFLWSFTGALGQMWAGVLSLAALFAALPLVTISIGLQSIDKALLEAAATMGATEGVSFRTIVLPQTIPYTMSGFFFALVLSFNEFIVMFFVSSSSYATVTLQIFNSLRNGFTPTMAVAAITFITVSVVAFSLVARFGDLPRLMGADTTRR
ncbi:ABC transporter permease [Chachezhania sediminis]|uniref:ABC transporter permease n=1 Tax=Chachezhania sediminis TaxID=2599291 RepID=UPI00131E2569|nr:ABC transporter permease subunit [Chachezhania sediminis]